MVSEAILSKIVTFRKHRQQKKK